MSTSATPLATRRGIREGAAVVLLGVADSVELILPPDVHIRLRHRAAGRADVVLACFTELAALERRLPRLAAMVHPAGGIRVPGPGGPPAW